MELMAASVYIGDGAIEVRELPVPEPGPGEVLIEVSHCGICGTDLHLVLEKYARPGSVLGHEWSGTDRRASAPTSTAGGRRPGGRADPTPGLRRVPRVRARPAVGVPAAAAARPPRRSAARSPVTRSSPAARLLAVPDALLDARGRAHRADRDRDPHGEPLGRDARRPRARHRRRPGRLAHDRGAARPRHRRHHGRPNRRRSRASARCGGRGARSSTPDELPRAPMGRPVAEPFTLAFECSGNAAAARVGARPARLRGHARVRRHRARDAARQPQPGRSCSSSRSSARTTTTPTASRPRSSCSRRARCRSTC